MVQVMSASTLTTSRSNSMCGTTHIFGKHFRLTKKSHVTFGFERPCLWYHGAQSSSFLGHSYILRERSVRVEAGWFFKGGDQRLDASSEHSESANVDILIFFFQLDLASQVQVDLTLFSKDLYFIVYTVYMVFTYLWPISITPHTIPKKWWFSIILCMHWQRALNLEEYGTAQQLRNKLSEVGFIMLILVNSSFYSTSEAPPYWLPSSRFC